MPRKRPSTARKLKFLVQAGAIVALILMVSGALFRPLTGSRRTAAAAGSDCANGGCRRGALDTTLGVQHHSLDLDANDDDYDDIYDATDAAVERRQKQQQQHRDLRPHVEPVQKVSLDSALDYLATCEDFACVKTAHNMIAGRTEFNFPHYFLVGWQKCATTSVNAYLRHHPQYLPGFLKESHWFSQCKVDPHSKNCHATSEAQYMRDYLRLQEAVVSKLGKVTFDASVDYARKGEVLASDLYDLFPWIKVVMIMREPISRVISYSRMYTERKHGEKGCFKDSPLFDCLQPFFEEGNPRTAHYDDAMEGWLAVFPSDQIHVIQFEQLQEDPNKILHDLKIFLGMNPALPNIILSNLNNRKAGGYPMKLSQYEELVASARPHAKRLANLLADEDLVDVEEWMARWEAVWKRQVEEGCDENGDCLVNSN